MELTKLRDRWGAAPHVVVVATVDHQVARLETSAAQGECQNFVKIFHHVHLEGAPHILREIVQIRPILLGEYDGPNPGAHGAQHLFFFATDRQHATPERDLTGHREIVTMATALVSAGRRDKADTSAVAIVTPADGPSFGIAPAGTWIWMSVPLNAASGMPSWSACDLAYVSAARADSFMTSPSWPVSTSSPLPRITLASTNMMSPPTGV